MIRFLTAGESHGMSLTAILEGMPAGLPISIDKVNYELSRRQKGFGSSQRMKIEQDTVQITSEYFKGKQQVLLLPCIFVTKTIDQTP